MKEIPTFATYRYGIEHRVIMNLQSFKTIGGYLRQ